MYSNTKILLVTPPLTQPNTPYPATPFLKGFFDKLGVDCAQMDLGLEVILKLLSKNVLKKVFSTIESKDIQLKGASRKIVRIKERYINTIDPVIQFMQGKTPSLAHIIANGDFLPQGKHFNDMDDMEWAFGVMGVQDKARHFATLYLEDITELITDTIDRDFGFSRYAEKLCSLASSFDEIYERMSEPLTLVDKITLELLNDRISIEKPTIIGITVPFPGNLYSALRAGEYIKKNYPACKIVMGGGFVSTELRSISDNRFFEFVDFLTLDDGERPWAQILEYIDGKITKDCLVRTFVSESDEVKYYNNELIKDYAPGETGTPSYDGLPLDKYISVIEMTNPMHSLWSNGRWNKLMLAHGCYWGKCAFCDGSLDYIGRYEPNSVEVLVDRIEKIIEQTGERGFHFIDEAAPPALLRSLSEELIKRKITITWWTNIRFEKSFNEELCHLMKKSGCIAVSGGLEVASDRLLRLIGKGVTVEQVARVTDNFANAEIMVHAYLMYGFPTQSAQETIDSLEVVRQLFEEGLIQSGFWHRFALTAHSPVGCNPDKFSVRITEPEFGGFAHNEIDFDCDMDDPSIFSEGLRTSLYNYMRGVGLDMPLGKWFGVKVPRTQLPRNYIARFLRN